MWVIRCWSNCRQSRYPAPTCNIRCTSCEVHIRRHDACCVSGEYHDSLRLCEKYKHRPTHEHSQGDCCCGTSLSPYAILRSVVLRFRFYFLSQVFRAVSFGFCSSLIHSQNVHVFQGCAQNSLTLVRRLLVASLSRWPINAFQALRKTVRLRIVEIADADGWNQFSWRLCWRGAMTKQKWHTTTQPAARQHCSEVPAFGFGRVLHFPSPWRLFARPSVDCMSVTHRSTQTLSSTALLCTFSLLMATWLFSFSLSLSLSLFLFLAPSTTRYAPKGGQGRDAQCARYIRKRGGGRKREFYSTTHHSQVCVQVGYLVYAHPGALLAPAASNLDEMAHHLVERRRRASMEPKINLKKKKYKTIDLIESRTPGYWPCQHPPLSPILDFPEGMSRNVKRGGFLARQFWKRIILRMPARGSTRRSGFHRDPHSIDILLRTCTIRLMERGRGGRL